MIVLAITAALLLVCAAWAGICNERTYRQRVRLICALPLGKDYWSYSEEFDAVTYRQHMWALFFLRNPRNLYGPLTQQLWSLR